MKIVMAAGEMVPFVKTGGLADVIAALSRDLAAMGHEVLVFLPYYRNVREQLGAMQFQTKRVRALVGKREVRGTLRVMHVNERLRVAFVDQPDFFNRPHIYRTPDGEYEDNAARYIFFSKAVVAGVGELGFPMDVLHAHDWHAAFAIAWWKHTLRAAWPVRTVFTIHNLAYQGVFPATAFNLTNLPPEYFDVQGLEFYGQLNLMKAGLIYSDVLTTVSRRYAEEIQTAEFGCGLEGLLRNLRPKLHGVLNGVDYTEWNPETDAHIPARYSASDLTGKAACKRALLASLKMPVWRERAPLIGMVSRMVGQKGSDLVAEALEGILGMDATLVVLGTGEPKIQQQLAAMGRRFPSHLHVHVGFSNALAHQIEAGADMFLMPSRFEPCGLNQMYSLRYGTIPVVRATGGLADTVRHFNPATGEGNGFVFEDCTNPKAMLTAIREALDVYCKPAHWNQLVQNAMACDFSWPASVRRYVQLYEPDNLSPII